MPIHFYENIWFCYYFVFFIHQQWHTLCYNLLKKDDETVMERSQSVIIKADRPKYSTAHTSESVLIKNR